jgi:ABC-2 type transport system ATP-binding protein
LLSIQASELEKTFASVKAVDRLSFEVEEGEVFGLLGPNGAGKTTTIRILACLLSPTGGNARVCGFTITDEPAKVRQRVGILTENPCLYERLTAFENMDFFAKAYGVSSEAERNRNIRRVLDFFELWDRRADKVAYFSKGMKQKLAIARALVHGPPVLLLDEPTAGLDPKSAKEVRDTITRLSRSEGCAILLSTHRLEDVERLCNGAAIIIKGRSIAHGSPEALREKITGSSVIEVIMKKGDGRVTESVRHIISPEGMKEEGSRLLMTVDDPESIAPEIVRTIVMAGGLVLSVRVLKPSLEDAYLRLIEEAGNNND